MNGYTLAWITWALFFVGVETKAVVDLRAGTKGETLSENLRALLGVHASGAHKAIGTAAFVLFILWFTPHILSH